MADRKISDLTALTTPATGDLIPIVDISEAAAADKNKSITVGELLRGAPDGTAAAPGFAFESDGGNGMFLAGTDQVGIATNGVERVEFGTTEVVFNDGGADVNFRVEGDTNANALFVDAANDCVGIGTGSVPSGNVNFVVNRPDGPGSIQLAFNGADGGAIVPGSSGGLEFFTYTGSIGSETYTERMRIDSSGRVGIGTTSPVRELQLGDNTSAAEIISLQTTTSGQGSIYFGDNTATSAEYAGVLRYDHTDNSMQVWTSSTERARIDSSGRLLVGTSTSLGADCKFQVSGNANIAEFFTARTDLYGPIVGLNKAKGSSASPAAVSSGDHIGTLECRGYDGTNYVLGAEIRGEVDGTPGTNDMPGRLVFSTTKDSESSPTEAVRIDADQLFYSAPSYNSTTAAAANLVVESTGKFRRSTSSAKYKTDIETLQDSYADALLSCRPVWYRSTCAGDNPDWGWWGFIAEEVAAVDPRLVHWKTVEVTYEEGSAVQTPCDPEPEGVAYDRFVPHLLNLIKRQGEAIAELQAKVAALEAQ